MRALHATCPTNELRTGTQHELDLIEFEFKETTASYSSQEQHTLFDQLISSENHLESHPPIEISANLAAREILEEKNENVLFPAQSTAAAELTMEDVEEDFVDGVSANECGSDQMLEAEEQQVLGENCNLMDSSAGAAADKEEDHGGSNEIWLSNVVTLRCDKATEMDVNQEEFLVPDPSQELIVGPSTADDNAPVHPRLSNVSAWRVSKRWVRAVVLQLFALAWTILIVTSMWIDKEKSSALLEEDCL